MTGQSSSVQAASGLVLVQLTLAVFSTSYNIFLYLIYNGEFRRSFVAIFCCVRPSAVHPSVSTIPRRGVGSSAPKSSTSRFGQTPTAGSGSADPAMSTVAERLTGSTNSISNASSNGDERKGSSTNSLKPPTLLRRHGNVTSTWTLRFNSDVVTTSLKRHINVNVTFYLFFWK